MLPALDSLPRSIPSLGNSRTSRQEGVATRVELNDRQKVEKEWKKRSVVSEQVEKLMEEVSIVWRARGDLNPGPPAPQASPTIVARCSVPSLHRATDHCWMHGGRRCSELPGNGGARLGVYTRSGFGPSSIA